MNPNSKDFNLWLRAHQLCLEIFKMTQTFPEEDRYRLTSQIKRSALIAPSSIAEKCRRRTVAE